MELRVLRYFLATAREGSILGAARFLHVTQPTLSRQLQDLEEELGQKLLIRSNRNIVLTPEGKLLRRRAEDIMEMVGKTEAEFGSMMENVSGDVYVGSGETEAMKLVARVIRELRDEYPKIRYHIFGGKSEDVEERVDKGILDFGILIQPVDISKYDCLNLPFRDIWGVIMRKDNPLAVKKSLSMNDLLDLPLICSRQSPQLSTGKSGYPEWFGKYFDKLNVVATYNLIYNAAQLVEAGIGCAIGLDGTINTTAQSALCFRPLEPKVESELTIIWKKYQVFSAAAEIFLERIQTKFPTDGAPDAE